MKDLLSGLDELGFGNLDELDALKTEEGSEDSKVTITTQTVQISDYVYDKSYDCLVCNKKFKEKTVKASKLKFIEMDIDLMPRYTPISPFYYNIVICPNCGYAALSENFMRITGSQETLIKNQIVPRYKYKEYTFPFTEDSAIERYKYALLNSIVKKGRIHERAYLCLVISWLYKIKEDENNQLLFSKNAYEAFLAAYGKETFPFFGMNEVVTSYLLGELARCTGDNESAIKWTSKVLSSRLANDKVKEMALDLKRRITGTSRIT